MRRRILTASLAYPPNKGRLCERALDKHPPVNRDQLEPLLSRRGQVAADVPPIVPEVNHSRWIARCPFCVHNAQVVDPGDPHFICAGADGCMNLTVDGAYVSIAFPAEREQIERVLSRRLAQSKTNWRHPQTVAELEAENVALGVN